MTNPGFLDLKKHSWKQSWIIKITLILMTVEDKHDCRPVAASRDIRPGSASDISVPWSLVKLCISHFLPETITQASMKCIIFSCGTDLWHGVLFKLCEPLSRLTRVAVLPELYWPTGCCSKHSGTVWAFSLQTESVISYVHRPSAHDWRWAPFSWENVLFISPAWPWRCHTAE